MPRLTDTDYLSRRALLRNLWFEDQFVFALLSSLDQRHLHRFFQFIDELTDQQPLAHRTAVSRESPALPAQAGKAYARLMGESASPALTGARSQSGRRVVVAPLARPTINYKLLSAALLSYAFQDPELIKKWRGDRVDRDAGSHAA